MVNFFFIIHRIFVEFGELKKDCRKRVCKIEWEAWLARNQGFSRSPRDFKNYVIGIPFFEEERKNLRVWRPLIFFSFQRCFRGHIWRIKKVIFWRLIFWRVWKPFNGIKTFLKLGNQGFPMVYHVRCFIWGGLPEIASKLDGPSRNGKFGLFMHVFNGNG